MRRQGEYAPPQNPASPASSAPPRSDGATLARLLPYLWTYKWRVVAAIAFMLGAKLANVTPEPGSSVPTVISAWDMGYFDVEAECNDGGSWGACTYTGEGTSFGTASIDVTDLELKVQWGS